MALYEEARRNKSKLPAYLQQPGPTPGSFVRYERHGVFFRDGQPALYFQFSLDGDDDEDMWYIAELELDAAVYERAEEALGEAGLQQSMLGIGICAACWLLMAQPRTTLRIAAAAGSLSEEQVAFWTRTLRGTLAEFQYLNRLPFHPFVVAEAVAEPQPQPEPEPEPEPAAAAAAAEAREARAAEMQGEAPSGPEDGVLVPLGGGKDCLTMLELLRDAGVEMATDCVLFHLADHQTEWSDNWRLAALHRASGVRRCICVLFTPPRQTQADMFGGAFAENDDLSLVQGTPPWAAMVWAVGALVAAGSDCGYVAVGNERSANEGNGVDWIGEAVNHQYDKAFDWEQLAHAYTKQHISSGIYYFSGLMHWWEVQIAQKFCQVTVTPRYLHLFLSCNCPINMKTRWCAKCSKCCFVQLLLAAWLQPSQVCSVFGDDLFEDTALLPVYRVLLGLPDPADANGRSAIKPLECVGTVEEARQSLLLAADRHSEDLQTGLRTDLERARQPRNLERLLGELTAVGVAVAPESRARLKGAHLEDLNAENALPAWLLPPSGK